MSGEKFRKRLKSFSETDLSGPKPKKNAKVKFMNYETINILYLNMLSCFPKNFLISPKIFSIYFFCIK